MFTRNLIPVWMGIAVLGCAGAKVEVAGEAEAYLNQGNTYCEKGDYEQAIRDYTKAIEINPKFAEAYYNRGSAYKMKGDKDQAIMDYKKACELGLKAGCNNLYL